MNGVIADIERLVLENAQRAQDQAVYNRRYKELSDVIEHKRVMIASVQTQISDALCRKENARIFLQGLRDIHQKGIITEFDIPTWHSLVEDAKIMPNKTIIFQFRNGNEETVRIEEAH